MPLGCSDGDDDGREDGDSDGMPLGCSDGDSDGMLDGMLDGWDEGLLDGAGVTAAVEPMDVRKRTTLSFMTVIVWRLLETD